MKKRYLSIFLALTMVCGTACPAMAAEYDPEVRTLSEMETLSEYVESTYGGSDAGQETGSFEESETFSQEEIPGDFTDESLQTETSVENQDLSPQDETEVQEDLFRKDDIAVDGIEQEDLETAVDLKDIAVSEDFEEVKDAEEPDGGITVFAVIGEDEEDGPEEKDDEEEESDELNGLHQDPNGSAWYYYKDGEVDYSYTGFAENAYGWWYVEGGKVNFSANSVIQDSLKAIDGTDGWWYVLGGQVQTSFTGLADYSNSAGWWYIKNGKVDFSANTVAENKNGWWYVEGGKVQFSYTGFGKNQYGWWYIEGGKVKFSTNSVIQDTHKAIDGADGWWYVVGGQVQSSYTGVANYANSNGWWYVNGGKVQFSYTGFGKNNNGWWYVEGGKVKFSTNSVIQDTHKAIDGSDGWWYVVGGQVQTSYTGVANYANSAGWWYIKNGKVDFSANKLASNNNGTWYVEGGKVQFSYTGFGEDESDWWYIEGGKVNYSTNSVIQDTKKKIDGTDGWWYVVGGKVQTEFTGLADYSNSAGWWYINNGKVTFDYNGYAQNKNGWYHVINSKVDFSQCGVIYTTVNGTEAWWYIDGGKVMTNYTGVANYSNSSGWWYVKNGKVDFTYSGVASNNNGWWYVDEGKVIFEDCLTYAAQFVGANTSASQSDSAKLATCFNVLWSQYPYLRAYDPTPTASMISQFAVDMFRDKRGNCYRYAASFACIAKVLGYETRVCFGEISSAYGGMTTHGWTEVLVDGQWMICDADMQMNHPDINSYMRTEENFAYKHTCSSRFLMTISDGQVVWVQVY